MRSFLVVALLASTAHARPIRGSAGAGGALVLVGEQGDRQRAEVVVDLKPRSRYGGIAGWRAFDEERKGLVTGGLVYEAGAARPRLVLDLIVELGADLDQRAPLAGGGIRSTLTIIGPLGIALSTNAYLVIDGVEDSRLHLQSSALLVAHARW